MNGRGEMAAHEIEEFNMRAALSNSWDDLLSTLWFVPALLVIAGIALSSALIAVDRAYSPGAGSSNWLLFGGSPDAARELLSVIAGSLITVVAVAFSVTLVVVQQAASQLSPRLLRQFTKDRGNQVVLGMYIATFIYALLVMRQVRSSDDAQDAFVPVLSLTVGIFLALISVGMLVYFIHHTVQSVQVTTIVNLVRENTRNEIIAMFPDNGEEITDPPAFDELVQESMERATGYESQVFSNKAGYLRRIDEGGLEELCHGDIRLIVVPIRVGAYVAEGGRLVIVRSSGPIDEDALGHIRRSFVISLSRTITQDPFFGIRQLTDIAIKALSPGVNDPTTAEQAIAPVGDVIGALADRKFPSSRKTIESSELLLNRPTFADFVKAGFAQVRTAAVGNVHVTQFLLKTLTEIARRVSAEYRVEAVREEVIATLRTLDSGAYNEAERWLIQREANAALDILARAGDRQPDVSEELLVG